MLWRGEDRRSLVHSARLAWAWLRCLTLFESVLGVDDGCIAKMAATEECGRRMPPPRAVCVVGSWLPCCPTLDLLSEAEFLSILNSQIVDARTWRLLYL